MDEPSAIVLLNKFNKSPQYTVQIILQTSLICHGPVLQG